MKIKQSHCSKALAILFICVSGFSAVPGFAQSDLPEVQLEQRILTDASAWSELDAHQVMAAKNMALDRGVSVAVWGQGIKSWVRGERVLGEKSNPYCIGLAYGLLEDVSHEMDVSGELQALRLYAAEQLAQDSTWLTKPQADLYTVVNIIDLVTTPGAINGPGGKSRSPVDQQRIYHLVFADQKRLVEVDVWSLKRLEGVARRVGVAEPEWSRWVSRWAEYREPQPGDDLWALLTALDMLKGVDTASKQARTRILDAAIQRSLADPASLQEINADQLSILASYALELMDATHHSALKRIFDSVFTDEARLAEINAWSLDALGEVARRIGVSESEWSQWLERWAEHRDSRQDGDLWEWLATLDTLTGTDAASAEARARILEAMMQRFSG